MNPRRTLMVVSVCGLLAVVAGCPHGGFFGRYIVVNAGKEPVRNLTLSAGGKQKTWATTEPGQGWITDNLGPRTVDVTWESKSGETVRTQIDFSKAAGYRYKGDLIIEFNDSKVLSWGLGPEVYVQNP
jgi:hypothetical protein